jgi:hypothetical protein
MNTIVQHNAMRKALFSHRLRNGEEENYEKGYVAIYAYDDKFTYIFFEWYGRIKYYNLPPLSAVLKSVPFQI